MELFELTNEEKLLMVGSEYRVAKTRFWGFLVVGFLVWPLLIVAVIYRNRMSSLTLQARMLGARDDSWKLDPWNIKLPPRQAKR